MKTEILKLASDSYKQGSIDTYDSMLDALNGLREKAPTTLLTIAQVIDLITTFKVESEDILKLESWGKGE